MTDRARYRPTVKEGADGRPFLVFEPVEGEIPALRDTLVALDLEPDTTYEQAQELAHHMHQLVHGLALTRL